MGQSHNVFFPWILVGIFSFVVTFLVAFLVTIPTRYRQSLVTWKLDDQHYCFQSMGSRILQNPRPSTPLHPSQDLNIYHPEHFTKPLPLAPVCVISPARCPLVLKMTRSAPGVPAQLISTATLKSHNTLIPPEYAVPVFNGNSWYGPETRKLKPS
jgi:hypothetical protein